MQRGLFIRLAMFAAVFAVYWQALGHGFVDFDDPEYVRDNPFVLHGLTQKAFVWAFTTDWIANWHPVTWLSLMLDATIFGNRPWGFHLTNILLHAANVLLLLGLLERLTGAFWKSALIAALFAVHPMHVESVAWISERKDVLSMFFGLLAIRAYCEFVRDRDGRSYGFMLVWFALCLMSKPMFVTLPCLLVLLDFGPLKRFGAGIGIASLKPIALEKIPMVVLVAASSWVTYMVQVGAKSLDDGVWMPMGVRIENAVVSYVRYLGKLIWPVDLAVLYPNPAFIGRPYWTAGQVWMSAGALVAITALFAALWRARPWLIVGWLWFLGAMVPVIGLVQIGRHSMADRYAYLPYVGLYVIIAWELGEAVRRTRAAVVPVIATACAAIIACGVAASRQVGVWRDSMTLFHHALDVTTDNWLIHNNLGGMHHREGQHAEAVAQMKRALEIYPESASLWMALGGIHAMNREWFEAQNAFEQQLKLTPDDAIAHLNLASVLKERGRLTEAEAHLKRALEIDPNAIEKHRELQSRSKGS